MSNNAPATHTDYTIRVIYNQSTPAERQLSPLTGAFLSIGLMTNFLSLNEIFLISLHGKPILGVNLKWTLRDACYMSYKKEAEIV